MILLKIYFHIKSYFKLLFFRLLFFRKIHFGKGVSFRNRMSITIDKGHLFIGNNVFFNNDCGIHVRKEVVIGNDCIFGENVKIYDHNHVHERTDFPYHKQGFTDKKVTIEENCWVGSNVVILANVTIGQNAVIGANTVVYKDVPQNAIVLSNGEVRGGDS